MVWLVLATLALVIWGLVRADKRTRAGGDPAVPGAPPTRQLHELAQGVAGDLTLARDVLADPPFAEAVELLASDRFTDEDRMSYATGVHLVVSRIALEALARGGPDDSVVRDLIEVAANAGTPNQAFAFRALDAKVPPPAALCGDLLAAIAHRRGSYWMVSAPTASNELRDFVRDRLARGERPEFGARLDALGSEDIDDLKGVLRQLEIDELADLRKAIDSRVATKVDYDFLGSIGTVWSDEEAGAATAVLTLPHVDEAVARILEPLDGEPARSALVVGEPGVGKTSAVRIALARLRDRGQRVFEASAQDILAGQMYVGQLEERLQQLVRQIASESGFVWYVPDFHRFLWIGRYSGNPTSILDYLLPHIDRGRIRIVGEVDPAAYDKLVQQKGRVRTAMAAIRLEATDPVATRALVDAWIAARGIDTGPETIGEAMQLAAQFLPDARPGNVLRLLELTCRRVAAGGRPAEGATALAIDDMLATLSELTGLPTSILDDRAGLDVASLRERFEERVIGQPEAVDCLVERVAMIKAGVTDPTRPAGVFLFAGPTGTGKTEIAKTLSRFLFGSTDRMIRLDMSELQTAEDRTRVVGGPESIATETEGGGDASLTRSVRRQPFSVILLDEFEKAHPRVWDLFLQVFDDGRLSDHAGRTADFRHAIIILTSNLGAMVPRGTSPGFDGEGGGFRAARVVREIERSFRREFVNRLDRIVVFRPLSRETMRRILRKELDDAFARRGLRNRGWAVEFDDAAIEFLLDRGFTHDLGARPLRRAVERYVLSPLAMAIVGRRYPEGDQFLFVRRGDAALDVQFVDPDAPEPAPVETPAETPSVDARTIALRPVGTAEEIACLAAHLERLLASTEAPAWTERKTNAFESMARPGFWESDERFAVLGLTEYLDRIGAGLRTCASLLERVRGGANRRRERYPRDVVRRLAERLYVLEIACDDVANDRPREAFVEITGAGGAGPPSAGSNAFAARLAEMYRAWGRRRGMEIEDLAGPEAPARGDGFRAVLGVSGYGAFTILARESGLHVYDEPRAAGGNDRCQARVRVVPQPTSPAAAGEDPVAVLSTQAARALASPDGPLDLVRRYRERPSPLVRDLAHGWRTGRFESVIEGDFDLWATVGGSDASAEA